MRRRPRGATGRRPGAACLSGRSNLSRKRLVSKQLPTSLFRCPASPYSCPDDQPSRRPCTEAAPAPGDPDQRCSTEELLDAWTGIVHGFTHVNRMLAWHVEQETGLAPPDFFVLSPAAAQPRPGGPVEQAGPGARLFQRRLHQGGRPAPAGRAHRAAALAERPARDQRRPHPRGRATAERALAIYCAALRELVLRHLGTDGLRDMVGQMSRLGDLPPCRLAGRPEPGPRHILGYLVEFRANDVPGRVPAISAHRGGGELNPARRTRRYLNATAAGADYVEFDVRRTGDGVLVALHEARAGPGRPVTSVSYSQLCELTGHEVPRIAEVMRLLAGRAAAHIDLKDAGCAAAVLRLGLELLGPAGMIVTTGDRAVLCVG